MAFKVESLSSSANFIVFSTVTIVEASPCINQHVSNYPASIKIVLLWLQYAAIITCMCYIQFNTTVVPFDTSSRLEHHFQVVSYCMLWLFEERITSNYKIYPCIQLVADQENCHCCRNLQYSSLSHTVRLCDAFYALNESYMTAHCSTGVSAQDWWCSLETNAPHHLNLSHGTSNTKTEIE